MSETPEQNRMSHEEAELEIFPERFDEIYDFLGPKDGGIRFVFPKLYEGYTNEQKRNLIKVLTNQSVINFARKICDHTRKEIIEKRRDYLEEEGGKFREERLNRAMAHGESTEQLITIFFSQVGTKMIEENPNKLISLIEQTGMTDEGTEFDKEKYIDVQEMLYTGKTLEGYNDET